MIDRIKVGIHVRNGDPFTMFMTREHFRALLHELHDLEPKWVALEGETVIVHMVSDDIVSITQEVSALPSAVH